MGIRWIADGYADDHGGVLRDDVRVVVAERESGGGGGGRVHVLADHLEHVCDGECLVFLQIEGLRWWTRDGVAVLACAWSV